MTVRLDFALLGPLEVRTGPRPINVAGGRQRLVLAALLLKANCTVGIQELIATVWDDDPPETARRQIQNAVSQLRQTLARHGAADIVASESEGYRLRIEPHRLDLLCFESEAASGRRLAADGRMAEAARALRAALSRWRGAPLSGLPGDAVRRQATRLDELRLSILEECVECELACGQHGGLVAELTALVAEYPLRERLAASLMLALYRTGRQAEAQAVYRRVAAALANELGVDPGPELRRRYEEILRCDEAAQPLSRAERGQPTAGRPAQLPGGPSLFVGRTEHLRRLDTLRAGVNGTEPLTVVISAITGTAGIGKTTLALRWAHHIATEFPDGQLYVNLRGFVDGVPPMDPAEAIRGFLDAFDVPAQRIPAGLQAQTAMYRTIVAGKRILLVLDNARDAEQVRPLLPGTPGCLVVVTSRDRLTSLVATDGANPLMLDLFTADEAGQLLVRRLGAERVAGEPDAVRDIIASCARLPLALSVVAARAATYPDLSLEAIAAELRGASGLDALTGDDAVTDVRTVFLCSYRVVSVDAARLFRLIGLHPGPHLTEYAAASLIGLPLAPTRRLIGELVRAHLLAESPPGRYTLHDLLRAYAAELAESADTEADRRAALHRLFDHYLHTAHGAANVPEYLDPVTPDDAQPGVTCERIDDAERALAWFTEEHAVLLAVIGAAGRSGFDTHTWQLAWTLVEYFDGQGHWHDQIATQRIALAAAQRLADPGAEARSHRCAARAWLRLGGYDEARHHLAEAVRLYEVAGDGLGGAYTHRNLAYLFDQQGNHLQALVHDRQALDLFLATGHRTGQARALNAIGWYHAQLGDQRQALLHCRRALAICEEQGDRRGVAASSASLGYAHQRLGEHARAVTRYQRALTLFRALGHRYDEADTLAQLGDSYDAMDNPAAARAAWQHARDILVDLDHPEAEALEARLRESTGQPAVSR